MGYTITIKVKSKAIGDQIIAFYRKNLKGWADLVSDAGGVKLDKAAWYFRGPLWARKEDNDGVGEGCDGLSYCHRKLHIGFDYNCGLGEREYLFTIIRWLAVRFGDKAKNNNLRYLYDGNEWTEIILGQHDYLGLPTEKLLAESRWLIHEQNYIKELFKVDFMQIVRAEMLRLDGLWKDVPLVPKKRRG